MNISEISTHIDKILLDIIGNKYITDSDIEHIVQYITMILNDTLKIDKSVLHEIVKIDIEKKLIKKYYYISDPIDDLTDDPMTLDNSCSEFSEITIDLEEEFSTKKKSVSNYINSDSNSTNNYKNAGDLVNHKYDCNLSKYLDNKHKYRTKRVDELKKIPQYAQKSIEWLDQRKKCLTATAIATVIDEDPYKYPIELLLDKCGRGEPFIENENVHHGRKYEEIGTMFYMFRNNVRVAEYGLIPDQRYSHLAISPDGICETVRYDSNNLSYLVGRLLEIKFPKKRKIMVEGKLDGDICPHYYYVQVQAQLFVTQMDECDFLQCKIDEYESFQEYLDDTNPIIPGLSAETNLEKGCLIQLLPKDMINDDPKMCLYNAQYLYPPRLHMTETELKEWIGTETMIFHENPLSEKYIIDRVIYWRLAKVACNLIKSDKSWFESKLPTLKQFWDYVLYYQQHPKALDNIIKHVNKIGVENSEKIFKIIHRDFTDANPDTKYTRLYKSESTWRKYYNKHYAYLKKYRKHVIYV